MDGIEILDAIASSKITCVGNPVAKHVSISDRL